MKTDKITSTRRAQNYRERSKHEVGRRRERHTLRTWLRSLSRLPLDPDLIPS